MAVWAWWTLGGLLCLFWLGDLLVLDELVCFIVFNFGLGYFIGFLELWLFY